MHAPVPDINVELILDNGLTDIVTERYDAGVRMGEHLANEAQTCREGSAAAGSFQSYGRRKKNSFLRSMV